MIDHSDYELFKNCFFLPLIRIIKYSGVLIPGLGSEGPSWTFQIINSWVFVCCYAEQGTSPACYSHQN